MVDAAICGQLLYIVWLCIAVILR